MHSHTFTFITRHLSQRSILSPRVPERRVIIVRVVQANERLALKQRFQRRACAPNFRIRANLRASQTSLGRYFFSETPNVRNPRGDEYQEQSGVTDRANEPSIVARNPEL